MIRNVDTWLIERTTLCAFVYLHVTFLIPRYFSNFRLESAPTTAQWFYIIQKNDYMWHVPALYLDTNTTQWFCEYSAYYDFIVITSWDKLR